MIATTLLEVARRLPAPVWGKDLNLGIIRNAAIRHHQVRLQYRGRVRYIEPYSIRKTAAGNTLLYGVRVKNGLLRSYRVDRIESARVSTLTFAPRHPIELGKLKPESARAATSLVCPYCLRRFKHYEADAVLKRHTRPVTKKVCFGSAKHGVLRG